MEKVGKAVMKIRLYFISGQKVTLQEAKGELNPKHMRLRGKRQPGKWLDLSADLSLQPVVH